MCTMISTQELEFSTLMVKKKRSLGQIEDSEDSGGECTAQHRLNTEEGRRELMVRLSHMVTLCKAGNRCLLGQN